MSSTPRCGATSRRHASAPCGSRGSGCSSSRSCSCACSFARSEPDTARRRGGSSPPRRRGSRSPRRRRSPGTRPPASTSASRWSRASCTCWRCRCGSAASLMMAFVVMRGNEIEERRDVVLDFSFVATWCVLALIASGAFQTWRQVRSLDALRDTDFGHILVIKLVVVRAHGRVRAVQPRDRRPRVRLLRRRRRARRAWRRSRCRSCRAAPTTPR